MKLPNGMTAAQIGSEQFHYAVNSMAMLKTIFNQNLKIMEKLQMGSKDELEKEWGNEFEIIQAEEFIALVDLYPPKDR